MAVSPKWRFVLANSNDLSNIGELVHATGRSLTLTFNRPGAASFSIPMSDDIASQIWPFTSAIKCYRRNAAGVWQLIWSGFVWTIDEDVSGGKMTVNAVGWLQILDKRLLRRIKDYTAVNPATGVTWKDFEIIYDLLADANATTLAWDSGYTVPVIAGANPATPTLIQAGASSGDFSTHGRQVKFDKYTAILSQMYSLTDIENGLDLEVDPATRVLNTWAKRMVDNPNAVFGFGDGTPQNLSQFGRQLDPSTTVNYLVAMGQDNTIVPRFADTKLNPAPSQNPPLLGEDSMQTYGIIEESQALSGAKNTEILATYAAAEVLLRSSPRLIYTMTPLPFTTTIGPGRIPEPFVEYGIGSQVYLDARYKGRFDIRRQAVRVFGMNVTPDDNGNEILGQLQISPS